MMRRQNLLPTLTLCAAVSGCAVNLPADSVPVEPIPAPVALTFAERVAAMPEGTAQSFAEGPFGLAVIEAGSFYQSGLGSGCRSIRVLRGDRIQRVALCKQANGAWKFLPSIFESMPR